MTQLDITKLHSSSLTPGLQDLGSIPDTVLNYSGSIPIASINTATMTLAFPTNKVISLIKINIVGAGVDSLWFPLIGSTGILTTTGVSGATYIYFTVQSSGGGRQINIQFVNDTAASVVTVSNLVITAHAHLYSYGW